MGAEPRIQRDVAPPRERRIAAAVFDADQRVRETVARAAEQAARIVAEAEAARDRVRAEAFLEGRREGEARAAAAVARAAFERDRLLREAAREVAGLALAVARRVLDRELADPGAVISLAERAVAEARGRREVAVRLHPDDAAALRGAASRLAAAVGGGPISLREDPSVARGGVVVEAEDGRIDGRIEAQLEVFARALDEALA